MNGLLDFSLSCFTLFYRNIWNVVLKFSLFNYKTFEINFNIVALIEYDAVICKQKIKNPQHVYGISIFSFNRPGSLNLSLAIVSPKQNLSNA